jgi:DNA-binding SARP family transcriptional activator
MNTREATRSTRTAGIELRVLGPFRLEVDGDTLEIGARKNKALIALLALEGPCSREWLAELLWGEFGEFGARKNLRKNLHRLRETALGPHLEVRGEMIELHASRVDALEFEQLVAALEFERALEVCTGTLLEGLEFESDGWMAWLEARRASLTARQREAFTGLATQRESQGDLRGALEVSARALLTDGFDEHTVREVMRLHLALGERDGALRVFERFREQAATMGFEPEAATRALVERARQGTLESEPDVPTDALHAPLVGRAETWVRLSRTDARLNVLVGEPGVGKTRLALEFAGTHGAHFVARGREEAARTPFAPVAQLVRDAIQVGAWSPDSLEGVWRLEVARLVPECAPDAVPPSSAGDGRSRFLEGLFRAVLLVINDQTLVLDDLHWFDEGTLELVSHLVRRADGPRFVATARALELEASEAARSTLEGLRRDGLSETIQLEPLAEPDVLAMV